MADGLLALLALACGISGMGLLALAQRPHWERVLAPRPYPAAQVRALRSRALVALSASLGLCLAADHPSLAVPIFLMELAASALVVAFTLAHRPRWLARFGVGLAD